MSSSWKISFNCFNYIDLFASYDYAKDTIKNSRGDKSKLEKIHFETKDNKIIVAKDENEEDKKKLSDESIYSKSTMIASDITQSQNKNSNNISVQISLDDYTFDKNEDYLKNDFIKPSYKLNPKKCLIAKNDFI